MKKIVLCIAVLLIPLLTGCGEKKEVELLLHCGAGIRPAAEALIAAFTAETGIKVNGNYAGSDRLLTQITAMHQGDLFMPGAAMYVDLAAEKGLGDQAAVCTVFYFVPVIFTAKDLGPPVQTLMDLMRPGLRMGLGDERACAVGKKTLKIFEKNKID